MAEPEDEAKYNEARLLALITGLSGGIMQHLGKVVNPLTGQIERDLQAAQGTIDVLRMLKEKTRGNLTDREERTLNAVINSAQLNFLDEVKAEQEKAKEKPQEKAEGVRAEEGEEKPAEETREEPPEEEKKAEETPEPKEALAEEKEEEPAAEKEEKPSQGKKETGPKKEPETEEESGETSADEDTPQA